jgi:hypothetical protein
MGAPAVNAMLVNQTAFTYTSTRSTFTQNVNQQVGIIVEFFSPVLPNDTERMSLPFSYMNVQTFSMDGAAHTVELYTDISAEWVSGTCLDVLSDEGTANSYLEAIATTLLNGTIPQLQALLPQSVVST